MAADRHSLVSFESVVFFEAGFSLLMRHAEHTLLVTEDGIEVLTARLADSPGGPVPMPGAANGEEVAEKTEA